MGGTCVAGKSGDAECGGDGLAGRCQQGLEAGVGMSRDFCGDERVNPLQRFPNSRGRCFLHNFLTGDDFLRLLISQTAPADGQTGLVLQARFDL